ncbi:microtubule-associated protein 10-like [Homalodisca vitripennis]|uniref:microtubule-associated protein 10-like n=1 Tax=Homalodisca vitripennis TaxID=197043 RepID=UPI001EEAFA60|nr:microtubule-associated protein 10-like [Homalodisca vitripennis]
MALYPEYEKLFLLEVLVDSVYINHSSLQLEPAVKANLKETCVMFQFLNYPPLVVCEEDFYKSQAPTSDTQLSFKSGKSCIFSIRSSLVPTLPYKFDVNVSVIRKVDQPQGKVVLGTSLIGLGDSFAALMHSSVAEPDLPLQKTKAGTFDLNDENDRKIGDVTAFIRLSCFGQLIVTQFQVGAGRDAFMFKGTEPKQVVEIPGDSSKMPKIEVDPNYVPPASEPKPEPDRGYGDSRVAQQYQQPDYGMYENYEQPQPQEDEGNYKEIVAEIRGHSLHIKVPMRPKKPKEDDFVCKKQLVDEIEGPVCKFAPPLNLCDCDFPVPPEAIPRCGPRM